MPLEYEPIVASMGCEISVPGLGHLGFADHFAINENLIAALAEIDRHRRCISRTACRCPTIYDIRPVDDDGLTAKVCERHSRVDRLNRFTISAAENIDGVAPVGDVRGFLNCSIRLIACAGALVAAPVRNENGRGQKCSILKCVDHQVAA